MIRSRDLVLSCFVLGLTLNASAQQSTPAASAPPPLVGTLAGHPDWPAAKNPGDVDTVDHLLASLYDVVSGPAGQRDWDRFRALFVPDGRLAWIVPESAATKDAPAREGRRPAILARHRFVPDCACSRTLLDRQPHL